MNASVHAADAQLSGDTRVAELLDELANRLQTGEPVDVEAFLAQHPEHAERLRRLVPAAQVLAELEQSGQTSAPKTADVPDPVAGVLGDFRIVREIGRGGMGVVYQAEQISLKRRVALKVLPFAGALDPRRLQRFQNEAQAAASLHHTNIVPVHGIGCERAVHFYAMQYIEGQSLAAILRELRHNAGREGDEDEEPVDGKAATTSHVPRAAAPVAASADTGPRAGLSTEQSIQSAGYFRAVAELGIQAAEALEHAHETGVIHRDIKPANLLVDGRGKLWITDFGLAQCRDQAGMTLTGDLVGTLRYMSPEQALAKRVVIDHRTDLYSLGVTLYELLTLEPAFSGTDRQELLRQIALEEPRAPQRLNKAIPPELATIVLKAMEKNATDRYASAQEMAEDLRRYLRHEPIRARTPTWLQRAGKWSRRHPAVVRSAAVLLLVMTVGSLLSAWLIWQEKKRTSEALEAETAQRYFAEEQDAVTRAVLDFVESKIFFAARPKDEEGGLGYDVKLAEAVRAALPFVERSFADQPLIEARLRMTIGQAFLDLGDPNTALAQLLAARQLLTNHHGADHVDTLRCMHGLANAYSAMGRPQEALELREETLRLREAKLGPNHPDTLRSMNDLAVSYAVGRPREALQLLREVLPLKQAAIGNDHPETLRVMNNLANVYAALGRPQEAIELREETLRLVQAKLGPDHSQTIKSMLNLAVSHGDMGHPRDALELRKEALRLCETKLGPDHPLTFQGMHFLATSYAQTGQPEEALKLDKEAFRRRTAKLGPDHPDTLASMNNLASSYDDMGRPEEALKLRQECLRLYQTKLGPDHPQTLVSMNQLAWFLATCPDGQLREPKRAVDLASQAVKLAPQEGDFRNTLGVAYYRLGDFPATVETLGQSVQLRNGGDPSDWFFLAMAHWKLGHQEQARKWYDKSVLWVEKNNPNDVETRRLQAEVAETMGLKKPPMPNAQGKMKAP
jgi:serine/threonine protein kinase